MKVFEKIKQIYIYMSFYFSVENPFTVQVRTYIINTVLYNDISNSLSLSLSLIPHNG